MNILNILVGIAGGGATYFAANWWLIRRNLKNMSYIEIRNAQISEEIKTLRKEGFSKKLTGILNDVGYNGDWTPILLIITFLYLSMAIVLSFFGINQFIGLFLALPLSFLFTYTLMNFIESRKEDKFKKQLLQVVSLVVTFLDNGDNPINAFSRASLSVSDPLQKEFTEAFSSMLTAEDTISSALAPIALRYPSRAFDLVMAALAIDDKQGAKLGSPLRQAQYALEREFELSSEANAELSQARSEFYGISTIIALIAVVMLTGSAESSRKAYTSPLGIGVLSVLVLNYILGIFRTLKIFARAKRGF